MATETERLERETEQTRAQLEQTLGELRARMSPGQLMDQASDYFRNGSGRAYLHNLRDEVVHNPVPITLIGAGIAWLALSGAIGRRSGTARDWGRTAGISDDLAHDGHGPSTMQRAKATAEDWAHEAGEAISETEERWRDRADDIGDRVSTAYDETVGRVRQTAEGWAEDARATADETRETLREGVESVRERTGELYERTASGFRRVTRKASDYGRTARDAVRPDGALLNFCREQPMLVAGLGVAFGAALAAMIPASRVEREAMGDSSRRVQDRIKEAAQDTWHAVGGERSGQQDGEQGSRGTEDRFDQAANDRSSGQGRQSGTGRSEKPSAAGRESWQGDSMGAREAAADVERGVKQSDRASNIETEPSRALYAEAAEGGAAGPGTIPGAETKQRT